MGALICLMMFQRNVVISKQNKNPIHRYCVIVDEIEHGQNSHTFDDGQFLCLHIL